MNVIRCRTEERRYSRIQFFGALQIFKRRSSHRAFPPSPPSNNRVLSCSSHKKVVIAVKRNAMESNALPAYKSLCDGTPLHWLARAKQNEHQCPPRALILPNLSVLSWSDRLSDCYNCFNAGLSVQNFIEECQSNLDWNEEEEGEGRRIWKERKNNCLLVWR